VVDVNFIPAELQRILRDTPELQQSYLVGGAVRDALLDRRGGRDFDIEVYGVTYEQLVQALRRWGRPDLVGRSFGVVKLTTGGEFHYDFTIPRLDSKVAPGHKGFEVDLAPALTPREAAARRDFTVNSILFDPRENRVIDYFGGLDDLRKGILRHTSAAFVEDPLRVLRGMQFAARFNLKADESTIALCRSMKSSFAELAVERVREEWFKWAQASATPSIGLRFLVDTGWVKHFPEIAALLGVPQEPEWHPEGDVFIHTCHCCDALARLPGWLAEDEPARIAHMLAVLAHDFGKAVTTTIAVKDGRTRIVSPGHEEAGSTLATTFLERLRAPNALVERVVPLVRNHLFHWQGMTDRAIRRLARRLAPENIEGLCLVMTADSMGRPPLPAVEPEHVKLLLASAHELAVRRRPPEPILLGRHLIELGLSPGVLFGEILGQAYEAQLEGMFFDLTHAWRWLAELKGVDWPEAARKELQARAKSSPE
jgi:tRNA nucleotidyltransferase (CCA-adding enzyme)